MKLKKIECVNTYFRDRDSRGGGRKQEASVFGPAKEGGVHAYQSDCVRGETTENDRLENSL